MFSQLIIAGSIYNLIAVATNGGRMPVYVTDGIMSWESKEHYTFTNKSEVNNFYTTDIIDLGFLYASIGDAIMLVGSIGIACTVLYRFNKRKS
jgi:hypothetical protein